MCECLNGIVAMTMSGGGLKRKWGLKSGHFGRRDKQLMTWKKKQRL